jgi:hypothetical protein
MTKCIAIKLISGTENLLTRNNNLSLSFTAQFAFDWAKHWITLKPGPMISEQTLVFQSNFSVQTPPKLYDPLSKLRFGTYGIDFVKHGTISAKFIDRCAVKYSS